MEAAGSVSTPHQSAASPTRPSSHSSDIAAPPQRARPMSSLEMASCVNGCPPPARRQSVVLSAVQTSQTAPVTSSASLHTPNSAVGANFSPGSNSVAQSCLQVSPLNKKLPQNESNMPGSKRPLISAVPSCAPASRAHVAPLASKSSVTLNKLNSTATTPRGQPIHHASRLSTASAGREAIPHSIPLMRQLPPQCDRVEPNSVPRPPPLFASQQYVILPQNPPPVIAQIPDRTLQRQQPALEKMIPAFDAAKRQMLAAPDHENAFPVTPVHPRSIAPQVQPTQPSAHQPLPLRGPLHPSSMCISTKSPSTVPYIHPQQNSSCQPPNSASPTPTTALTQVGIPRNPTQAVCEPQTSSPNDQDQQQSRQFSRSRLVSRHREPTLIHYYERLDKTVQEATDFSKNLRCPVESSPSDQDQFAKVVAHDLQGVFGSEVDALLRENVSNKEYIQTFNSKLAGDFVEYGVSGTHLSFISDALIGSADSAPHSVSPITPQQTHSHPLVERARVRVFEAEISHLPLAFVEKLVKNRRSMRRFKSRIELHVRIILALEGKGRKVSDAQLDRLKLQLEKADQQADNDRKRRMAAEAAKLEKERRAKEPAKQNEKNGFKEKELKKRRRQEHAQASFMKRFVKPKIEERHKEEKQEVRYVPHERLGHFAQTIADDPDVMTLEWWLRCEVQFVPESRLDELFKEGAGDINSHLRACAARREAAEKTINDVLHDYRTRRRVPHDDRCPRFVRKRADVRGRGKLGPVKLLQFDENYRPAYYGTFRRSEVVCGRRPFKKDGDLNYDHDSEAEWEEEEGEDIQDMEDDKELASEEAELKKLYGSDDEDDDDFLDDDEAGDDDDDDEEGDDSDGQTGDSEKKTKEGEIVDLTKNTQDVRKARDAARVKRRKLSVGSVVIDGVNFTGASKLDAFPVSTFANSKPIQMFNPFVFSASDIVAEHLKAKLPSARSSRPSNIDEKGKLDLAVALVNDGSNRDRIVLQFCESRRTRGLNVPAKSEVVRAISEMATREKRDGDTRATWHLTDTKLERMVQQMGNVEQAGRTVGPITIPVSALK
ncbi:unnamed protein product [Agarophyton chilense]|eukprot:gb/GEZJ01003552.1/.p1 GENE.gb/GEZJ01003552.1/~~gb/GEZJ01003552.1/.p1  ORF type:complete len:1057 (+),score=193.02 gb/GEZJ01003552.1/:75-3245(+)